jgi:hypothetical protein
MSDKFHINRKGEVGGCTAQTGGCPFGGESEHYSSPEAAQKAYENLQKAQVPPAMSKTAVDPNSLTHHSATKNSTQIAETPGDEMTKEELNLYAYSIVSHNMQPAIGQLRWNATKDDGGVRLAATMKHIREVYIPTAVSDVAAKLGGDSKAVSSFLKEELEKIMNPLFELYTKDPHAKVDLDLILKSWADTVADYSGKT